MNENIHTETTPQEPLITGDVVKKALKKKSWQGIRIAILWIFSGIIITAVSMVIAWFGNGDGSYYMMWGLSLYGIFRLFTASQLVSANKELIEQGIDQETLDSLKVSSLARKLSKIGIIIGSILTLVSLAFGAFAFYLESEITEDYGVVVNNNVNEFGWITYKAENENFQINLPQKPYTYSSTIELDNYEDEVDYRLFYIFGDNVESFDIHHESLLYKNLNHQRKTDILQEMNIFTQNIHEGVQNINIISQTENEIFFSYEHSDTMKSYVRILIDDSVMYTLGYTNTKELLNEDKWKAFETSFKLLNQE